MRVILASILLSTVSLCGASARDVPPPPPLIDYAEASYVGLSYVAVCAPARTYALVLSSPFGDGPHLQSLTIGGAPVTTDELASANGRLAAFKSFTSLTVQCLTRGDLILIEGYPKAASGPRPKRVTLRIADSQVFVD